MRNKQPAQLEVAESNPLSMVEPCHVLSGPTFFHISPLAYPAGSTWSRQGNKSMGERCFRQAQHMRALLPYVKGSRLTRLGG